MYVNGLDMYQLIVSEQALCQNRHFMRAASHIHIVSLVSIDYVCIIFVLNKLPSALTSSQC